MIATTIISAHRWDAKSDAIRRKETVRAAARSVAVTDAEPPERRPRCDVLDFTGITPFLLGGRDRCSDLEGTLLR
jgi:hypothetical protein